jgi:hypothetical protein
MERKTVLAFSPAKLQTVGPVIKVIIGNTAPELAEARAVGLEFPAPLPFSAVVDTGAAVTIINPQLAETFKLKYTGPARISSVGNVGEYRAYAASIAFPGQHHLKSFDVLRVIASPLAHMEVSCLIGRDILRYWEFTYNGKTGEVTIKDLRT